MATRYVCCIGLLAIGAICATASAAEEKPLIARVRDACGGEIRELCAKITPGEGRVIACLYAHEDELSGRCDYVVLEAASQLLSITTQMNEVARVCKPDIELLCQGARPGEGRIAQCLRKHQKALSVPCAGEIEKTGIDVL
ncbi:MAG TPA: cysteine rich repeat-containing protein [Xanthomonadales bacterium]|nr:cysteine rich repeat-containing protein [Xanthomonadales bacterium]